jgi:UDP-N-acetylglucosamine--N-acetylmuramyl-(pentapeptide) pyrophosphoryl-undecaprenol N-acetylglucosamine transferase
MTDPTRILLTGGGTAGHVNPALAIGRALAGEGARLLYVGVRGRAESKVVPREDIPIRYVRASGYPGMRPSAALAAFFANLSIGIVQAVVVLLSFRPDVIVATGGFASAPVMFAAALLRKLGMSRARVYVHEQNAAPGKLNQVVGSLADRVFVTFPETLSSFPSNGLVTGYPLRKRISSVYRATAAAALDFTIPPGRQIVFAFGGSQGARTVNRAVVDALADLLPYHDRLFIIHGTGLFKGRAYDAEADTRSRLDARYGADERRVIDTFYVARPFFYQIENVYAVADLVVARAGAGTLYELASLGLPAIIVPKANLPGDHQVMNARAMARCGGATVLYEETTISGEGIVEELDGGRLAFQIVSLLADGPRLLEMRHRARTFVGQDALEIIVRSIRGDRAAGLKPDAAPDESGGAGGEGRVTADKTSGAEVNGQDRVWPDAPALPSNQALLAQLERAAGRAGAAYCPEQVVQSPDDRAYYVSRAASLLASSSWEQRNLGVKLLGLMHARDKLPLLLALLADKRPAPWPQRLLGGDYWQVGFIRRNVLTAIGRLGVVKPEVERALLVSFDDPYFEARAEAVRTASRLAERLLDRAAIVEGLRQLLSDRWLEVAAAAAEALGKIGGANDALPALLALKDAKYWMVRAAALEGILSLVRRGEAGDHAELKSSLQEFVLTSTDFKPEFQIKRLYGRVVDAMTNREGGAR